MGIGGYTDIVGYTKASNFGSSTENADRDIKLRVLFRALCRRGFSFVVRESQMTGRDCYLVRE